MMRSLEIVGTLGAPGALAHTGSTGNLHILGTCGTLGMLGTLGTGGTVVNTDGACTKHSKCLMGKYVDSAYFVTLT